MPASDRDPRDSGDRRRLEPREWIGRAGPNRARRRGSDRRDSAAAWPGPVERVLRPLKPPEQAPEAGVTSTLGRAEGCMTRLVSESAAVQPSAARLQAEGGRGLCCPVTGLRPGPEIRAPAPRRPVPCSPGPDGATAEPAPR